MIKQVTFVLFCSIFLLVCSSNNNIVANRNNNSKSKQLSPKTKKVLKLLKKIKSRTEKHLSKVGVKNMLLSCNGRWDSAPNGIFIFHKNGILINIYKGKKDIFGYWKVLDNKLFIKPVLKSYEEFFFTKVKAIQPGYCHPDYLQLWKYSLQIEIIINQNKSIFFTLAGIKNI